MERNFVLSRRLVDCGRRNRDPLANPVGLAVNGSGGIIAGKNLAAHTRLDIISCRAISRLFPVF